MERNGLAAFVARMPMLLSAGMPVQLRCLCMERKLDAVEVTSKNYSNVLNGKRMVTIVAAMLDHPNA